MVVDNEHLNKNQMYDFKIDYLSEIYRIKKAISNLELKNDDKFQTEIAVLRKTLSLFEKTASDIVLYIEKKLYYYAIASKNNADNNFDNASYINYCDEIQKTNYYQMISNTCINMTTEERDLFVERFYASKELENSKSK